MDTLGKKLLRCILASEPSKKLPKEEKADMWEKENEEVQEMQGCQGKSSGLEDREF